MTEPTTPSHLPEPKRERQRNWLPSLIWLIPIVAAVVGLTLVVKIVLERGPLITISFISAEGLEAGKTKVKYKDVDIGQVQSITLSKDRSHVVTTVQLTKEAESFTADDTRFWVVRPRVAASGVSGLNTLFSGAYIGADAGKSDDTKKEFAGLEQPPIITRDTSGKQFVLHAADLGSLDIGSPVFFRRIKVGQLAAYDLDRDGKGVTLRIFVNAPYDKFVSMNSRFWHASGFDMQLNASGFKLHTQSLATVILGGIAFKPMDDVDNPAPARENTSFRLADDETAALKDPDGRAQMVLLYFNQSLRGLEPGALVDFRGVVLGEVKSIGIEYDDKARQFIMPVLVELFPDRLGRKFNEEKSSSYAPRERMRYLVAHGLRAQLRSGSLLTGQLYIALDIFPKAPPAEVNIEHTPPIFPTIPNALDEIQTQIADVTRKLSKVPFDKIGDDLHKTLGTLNRTLTSAEQTMNKLNNDVAPEITAAMHDARKTLNAAERTLSDDAPLQRDVRQTMQELSRAAASIRVLTDYLQQHPESLIRGKPEDK
jgi:paraquat-inducible protein B